MPLIDLHVLISMQTPRYNRSNFTMNSKTFDYVLHAPFEDCPGFFESLGGEVGFWPRTSWLVKELKERQHQRQQADHILELKSDDDIESSLKAELEVIASRLYGVNKHDIKEEFCDLLDILHHEGSLHSVVVDIDGDYDVEMYRFPSEVHRRLVGLLLTRSLYANVFQGRTT